MSARDHVCPRCRKEWRCDGCWTAETERLCDDCAALPAPADAAPSPEEMCGPGFRVTRDEHGFVGVWHDGSVDVIPELGRALLAERARAAAREQEQESRHRAELLSAAGLTRELAGEVERLRGAYNESEALRSRDATIHMRIAAKNDALVAIVRRLLASAVPNERDHPTMAVAWAYALSRLEEAGIAIPP